MDLKSVAEVVGQARKHRDAGDRDEAIRLLTVALDAVTKDGDHFLACYLTHDLGHAEQDPQAQLHWHQAALDHADAVGDERVKGFYGSLHVNLGATYLRLGDRTRALEHCEKGEQAIPNLADNAYGQRIRGSLTRLREQLDADT